MLKKIIYLAGSMENRNYYDVYYERLRLVEQLETKGFEVIDPLRKEKHIPGQEVGLSTSGIEPKQVFWMDIRSVETSDIIIWYTGDICSEGSEVEFAAAGYFNRLYNKGYIKEDCPIKKKRLVIVSRKRNEGKLNHFQNMWRDCEIYGDIKEMVEGL